MWYIVDARNGRKYWIPQEGLTVLHDGPSPIYPISESTRCQHYAVIRPQGGNVEVIPAKAVSIENIQVVASTIWHAGKSLRCGNAIFTLFYHQEAVATPNHQLHQPTPRKRRHSAYPMGIALISIGLMLLFAGIWGLHYCQVQMNAASGFFGQLALTFGGDETRRNIGQLTMYYNSSLCSIFIGGTMFVAGLIALIVGAAKGTSQNPTR